MPITSRLIKKIEKSTLAWWVDKYTDQSTLNTMVMAAVEIGENAVLILQPTIPSDWRVGNRGKGAI
jgi:hypothetical protein